MSEMASGPASLSLTLAFIDSRAFEYTRWRSVIGAKHVGNAVIG